MQITSTNFSPIVTKPLTYKSPASTPTDQAQIGISPSTFQKFVQDAKNVPEVRDDVVKEFQARIKAGTYPSTGVLNGLADHLSGILNDKSSERSTDSN